MDQTVFIVNRILAFLTLISDGAIVFLLVYIPVFKKIPFQPFFKKYAFHFSLIIALTAVGGSLFYSEIAGYTPCLLCWYQRIFMYPQPVLISLSILKKDRNLADYLIVLSGIGLLIALYHYFIQRGGSAILPCSAVGYSVECSSNFIMEFGYITIPVMAATAFLLIIILMMISKYGKNRKRGNK